MANLNLIDTTDFDVPRSVKFADNKQTRLTHSHFKLVWFENRISSKNMRESTRFVS